MSTDRVILVTGATGKQGGAVARKLLSQGFPVRAATRDPDKTAALALTEQGADVVQADLDDLASVERAVRGAYGIFSVQNFWEAGAHREVRQGKTLADLAKEAGVSHFVYSSVGSAQRETGIPHFDSKWEIEEHIRRIDIPHTILRPTAFMDNWASFSRQSIMDGVLAQPLSPEKRMQQVATDDIGAFAAIAFSHPDEWLGRAVDLAGDEPTMLDTASTFARVIGRSVEYLQVTWDDVRTQFGEEMTIMYKWFEDVGYEADIAALRDIHPDLMTLEPYLRATGWA